MRASNLPLALLLSLAPAAAAAQATHVAHQTAAQPAAGLTVPDSVYQRALRLVTEGNGADGRAIVDSLLNALPPGSMDYAEALYWRAALASTAAEAERGYLRLTVEYPLSPRVEEALLRLGQLEQTRGNKAVALSRFERAASEFPDSPRQAHTQLQIARIYLDENRLPEGCAAVAAARRALGPSEVELRTQVEYQGRRCAGVALPAPAAVGMPAAPAPTAPPARADDARVVRTAPPSRADSARRVAAPADSAPRPRVVTPPRADSTPRATPRATPPRPAASRPAAGAAAAAPRAGSRMAPGFSVQLGAFDRREPAQAVVTRLRRQGHEARIDADGKWFRVRVGHWTDRAAADSAQAKLKAAGHNGFVAEVGG